MLAKATAFALTALAGLSCSSLAFADEAGNDPARDAAIKRGAYVATASDCAACHTAPGGKPFAGGLPISSPVGTIFSTNITPSQSNGIGQYTEAQFARALRQGIRADGANLYPAMPYTSYRLLSDQDVKDLYVYFMHEVKPVDAAPPRTSLPFPMNLRFSMMAWNLLFLDSSPFKEDPNHSAAWNRGAYLVNGPAHCSTCHTPRGILMQEEGSQYLAGATLGSWYAPNITSDKVSGIGSWSKKELEQYLSTGNLPGRAQAAGDMGTAVEHSFQHLTPSDIDAIATYIKSVPARPGIDSHVSRFDQGSPSGAALAQYRGVNGVRSVTGPSPSGIELFQSNCASCHGTEGQGTKDGSFYPSLFHNSATASSNPANLLSTILYGVNRKAKDGTVYFMPGFGGHPSDTTQLSNQQIATLASFITSQFGGIKQPVTEQDVATARAGGPASSLVLMARIGMAAGAVVAVIILACLAFWLRSRRKRA